MLMIAFAFFVQYRRIEWLQAYCAPVRYGTVQKVVPLLLLFSDD